MNNHVEPIWELIRRQRIRAGLSEPELAKAVAQASGRHGLTGHAVSRWERGEVIPGPDYRRWLAVVLEIPLELLEAAAVSAKMHRLASDMADPPGDKG